MHSFSIGEMAVLTGIKTDTWRLWEQRYPLLRPAEKKGRKRFYATKNLQTILDILFLYQNKWKISRIVSLSNEEISNEVEQVKADNNNCRSFVLKFFKSAIYLNEGAFARMINEVIENVGFEKTIVEIVYPYLEILKKLSDAFGPLKNLSISMISNRLISETETYTSAQNGPPQIVLCGHGNGQDIQLLFLNYLFRKNGWNVLYLGSEAKWESIKFGAQLPTITYLYVQFSKNVNENFTDDYLEKLKKSFPEKMILASGSGVQQSQRTFAKIQLLKNDKAIYSLIQEGPKS